MELMLDIRRNCHTYRVQNVKIIYVYRLKIIFEHLSCDGILQTLHTELLMKIIIFVHDSHCGYPFHFIDFSILYSCNCLLSFYRAQSCDFPIHFIDFFFGISIFTVGFKSLVHIGQSLRSKVIFCIEFTVKNERNAISQSHFFKFNLKLNEINEDYDLNYINLFLN